MKHFSFIFFCTLVMQSPLWAAQSANTVAGKVVFSSGNNTAISTNGEQRVIKQGDAVRAGDKLQTDNGQLQVRFTDNGFASLKPKSQLIITEYAFNGKEDGSEKAVFSLLKGSVRAVTGFIGKHNNKAYKYETPVATIGIRGTAFVLNFCNKDCFGTDGALLEDGLYVNNGEGRVYVENNEGVIDLVRGQFAFVQDVNSEPEQITQPPAMEEMFREETEDYDFDRRAGETLVENIRDVIEDNGLAELDDIQGMAYTLIGGTLSVKSSDPAITTNAGSSITTDNNGAVIAFEYFDPNFDTTVHFDSRNATPVNVGSNPILDATWGIWEGGYSYTDAAGTPLENSPQYLAYMGFATPDDLARLPTGGTADFDVQLPGGNGAVNVMTGATTDRFTTASISVDWANAMFTNFDLAGTFTDNSTFDMRMQGTNQPVNSSGVPLTGTFGGAFASGGANFQFADNASMIGGTFHVYADPSPAAVGTFLLGNENAIIEPLPGVITN